MIYGTFIYYTSRGPCILHGYFVSSSEWYQSFGASLSHEIQTLDIIYTDALQLPTFTSNRFFFYTKTRGQKNTIHKDPGSKEHPWSRPGVKRTPSTKTRGLKNIIHQDPGSQEHHPQRPGVKRTPSTKTDSYVPLTATMIHMFIGTIISNECSFDPVTDTQTLNISYIDVYVKSKI